MKVVLKLIEEEGPISRQRLLILSDLSRPATAAALRDLYAGLHVTRGADNRDRRVPDRQMGREAARLTALPRISPTLGVHSAAALAAKSRSEKHAGEARSRPPE